MITFEDASLGNTRGGNAQLGHIGCACDKSYTGAKPPE